LVYLNDATVVTATADDQKLLLLLTRRVLLLLHRKLFEGAGSLQQVSRILMSVGHITE